jgi:hypothetical protein
MSGPIQADLTVTLCLDKTWAGNQTPSTGCAAIALMAAGFTLITRHDA